MPQCLYDRISFLLRTLRLLRIFIFRFMVILSLNNAVLLLHLRNVEVGYLQLMIFPYMLPNLIVSRPAFRSSHIQLIHADVHLDVLFDMEFGQKENGLDMA